MKLRIVVPGPKGQGREDWRQTIATAAQEAIERSDIKWTLHTGPLTINARFFIPRPKTIKHTLHATRPDLGRQLLPALEDALESIVLAHGWQIYEVQASKDYGPCGATIEVSSP